MKKKRKLGVNVILFLPERSVFIDCLTEYLKVGQTELTYIEA